jgi:hypothetical protein
MRHRRQQGLAAPAPPVRARHVRLRPGFVDEDEALDRQTGLDTTPPDPAAHNIRTILLGGAHGFF